MVKVKARGTALLCTALLTTALLALSKASSFAAPVGVTSATDGDPVGKAPNEVERVLRVGIDVQANELITTRADDRAHLLFIDGTSITVGPNAQLTIDKYVFDPNTNQGDVVINASKGVLQLVGGKISKKDTITVITPSNTVGIRGGIGIFEIDPKKTTAVFVFGIDMKVKADGVSQVMTRPGSQVITDAGHPPGAPTLVPPGSLAHTLNQFDGKSGAGNKNGQAGGAGAGGGGGNADQAAQTSGFSSKNSGQGTAIGQPLNGGLAPAPPPQTSTATNALTNQNSALQQQQAQQQQQATPAPPSPSPPFIPPTPHPPTMPSVPTPPITSPTPVPPIPPRR